MRNWIPFVDGEYLVEQALLVASDDRAVVVEDVIEDWSMDGNNCKMMTVGYRPGQIAARGGEGH